MTLIYYDLLRGTTLSERSGHIQDHIPRERETVRVKEGDRLEAFVVHSVEWQFDRVDCVDHVIGGRAIMHVDAIQINLMKLGS